VCSPILLVQPVYCISDTSCILLTMRKELKGNINTVLQDKQDYNLIFSHLCTQRYCSQLFIYNINSVLGCSVKARCFIIQT
jgi:hypothetical protein